MNIDVDAIRERASHPVYLVVCDGQASADIAALLAEVERLRETTVPCSCGPWHPGMDGPEEDCPLHGRPYSDWVDRSETLAVEVDRLRKVAVAAAAVIAGRGDRSMKHLGAHEQLVAALDAWRTEQ